MQPAAGTTFERFGGAQEVDVIEALLAGYATNNDTVKEAAFQAFIHGDKPVAAVGRQVIARLSEQNPWIAAEFTFNLMAETQNGHYGTNDKLFGLDLDDCWDMAATSLPKASPEATYELAMGFCVLMDQQRRGSSRNTLAQCNKAAVAAVRNGCAPRILQLFVEHGVKTLQKEDERLVTEDRRRVEMFSSGLGTLGRKDMAAAARLQAAIDAHQPGEYLINKIKGTYEYSSLSDYEFSEVLTTTALAGTRGTEADAGYVTGIVQGVLARLDTDEISRFLPEIIDTYLALDPANQVKLHTTLTAALRISPFRLEDITEAKLREFAKSNRDERYSYKKPDAKYYKPSLPVDSQLFWPGDTVARLDSSPQTAELALHVIQDVQHNHYGTSEDEAAKYYDLAGSASTSAASLQLVARGELWKFCHGEIAEFTDPKAAYEYAMRACTYRFVRKRDLSEKDEDDFIQRLYESWRKDTVLEAIERGYADGFRKEEGIFTRPEDLVALKFDDPKLAELIANATLTGLGRKPRQAMA